MMVHKQSNVHANKVYLKEKTETMKNGREVLKLQILEHIHKTIRMNVVNSSLCKFFKKASNVLLSRESYPLKFTIIVASHVRVNSSYRIL